MSRQPEISVIIPVYNAQNYINKCIENIQKQSYDNFEIIIIDDGSTDDSLSICNSYTVDSRITVIHQNNNGVSNARNTALNHAVGNFIVFIDADDYVQNDYLEELYNAIITNKSDIAICGYRKEWTSSHKKNRTECQEYLLGKTGFLSYEELWFHSIDTNILGCYLWNKIFSREILSGISFDESLSIGEDMVFLAQCIKKHPSAYYLNKPLYNYQIRIGSAMNVTDKSCSPAIVKQRLSSSLSAAIHISRLGENESDYIKSISAYRVERSSLWVIYKMIILGYKDDDMFSKVKVYSRNHQHNYKNLHYGTMCQRISISLIQLSPKFVFYLGICAKKIIFRRIV